MISYTVDKWKQHAGVKPFHNFDLYIDTMNFSANTIHIMRLTKELFYRSIVFKINALRVTQEWVWILNLLVLNDDNK